MNIFYKNPPINFLLDFLKCIEINEINKKEYYDFDLYAYKRGILFNLIPKFLFECHQYINYKKWNLLYNQQITYKIFLSILKKIGNLYNEFKIEGIRFYYTIKK